MHLGQVKIWMRRHDCGADWELPEAEQHQLTEWFNALDIDGSGELDDDDVQKWIERKKAVAEWEASRPGGPAA